MAIKASESIKRANHAHDQMLKALVQVNKQLVALLGDNNASVFYQPSDGWCVLWGNDRNTPTAFIDIDKLLGMDRDSALTYLAANQV